MDEKDHILLLLLGVIEERGSVVRAIKLQSEERLNLLELEQKKNALLTEMSVILAKKIVMLKEENNEIKERFRLATGEDMYILDVVPTYNC